MWGGSSGIGSGSPGGFGGFGSGIGGVSIRKGIVNRNERGAVSGTAVVIVLLTIVAAVGGGLIWYKQQPQAIPPALNDDNGVMLLIPAGPFLYGPNKEQGVAPAFYIDRIEVTNKMYANFCRVTDHPLPPGFDASKPDLPVTNVTIEDATTFAKWAGKRLPDALEWEKACRGSDGRVYPWGNDPDRAKANLAGQRPGPILADTLQLGQSPYNILQMAGNVAEFTRSITDRPTNSGTEVYYQLRGSSFRTSMEDAARPWSFQPVSTTFRSPEVGFRCAKDPPRR